MSNAPATFSAVLFDLDGTLLDTAPDFYHSINRLRLNMGLTPIELEEVRSHVSNGTAALVDAYFDAPRGSDRFQQLLIQLQDDYLAHIGENTHLFKALIPLLDWLEQLDKPWGIVTNKPERFTLPLLSKLKLDKRCAAIICPEQVNRTKPDPEPLLLASQRLNLKPSAVIYVGDHLRDIEAGRRAGMRTIAALYGYIDHRDKPLDWQASFYAKEPSDIQHWLMQQQGTSQRRSRAAQ